MQVCAYVEGCLSTGVCGSPPANCSLLKQSGLLMDQDLWVKKKRSDKFIVVNNRTSLKTIQKENVRKGCGQNSTGLARSEVDVI